MGARHPASSIFYKRQPPGFIAEVEGAVLARLLIAFDEDRKEAE
jgi:hypothetical protein